MKKFLAAPDLTESLVALAQTEYGEERVMTG